MSISLCLATYNEEKNLESCLKSAQSIVDEIVIVDGGSSDKTLHIAKKYGAKVIQTDNPPNFHINKQKAIDACKSEWILQLDADEQLSLQLAQEIVQVTQMTDEELKQYQETLPKRKLFLRHQGLIEARDGVKPRQNQEYVAFYVPRLNYFLGTYLRHGGVYPDGAIRLIKKGKAWLPAKDVHEVMHAEGQIGWLANDLLHYDSPTFARYLERNNRYISLITREYAAQKMPKTISNLLIYMILKPIHWFLLTTIRHKGILDGWQGIVFSFFSALRFPRAYWRYLKQKN